MTRLRELTAVVRAGETGSFSRVARELGISQPSASRMVASLEARLGVKLLSRTTRHVAPTDAGRAFLEQARQILGDLDDAENAARGAGNLRGTLRVALGKAPRLAVASPAYLARRERRKRPPNAPATTAFSARVSPARPAGVSRARGGQRP